MKKVVDFPDIVPEEKEGCQVLEVFDAASNLVRWVDYVQSNEDIAKCLEEDVTLKEALKARLKQSENDEWLGSKLSLFETKLDGKFIGFVYYNVLDNRIKFEADMDSLEKTGWSKEEIEKFAAYMQNWNEKRFPPEVVTCCDDEVYEWLTNKGIKAPRVKPDRKEIRGRIVIGSLPIELLSDCYCLLYPYFERNQEHEAATQTAMDQMFKYFQVFKMKDYNKMNMEQVSGMVEGDYSLIEESLAVTK